jgi:hypothetical protein
MVVCYIDFKDRPLRERERERERERGGGVGGVGWSGSSGIALSYQA